MAKISYMRFIDGIGFEVNCPLFQTFIIEVFSSSKKGFIFLLDAPDNLAAIKTQYFENFIQRLREASHGTFVLMVTREQYAVLQKTEYFPRWTKIEFSRMTDAELLMMVYSRVKWASSDDVTMPFGKDALSYLVALSNHNPRELIKKCNLVLNRMLSGGVSEPVDVKFVTDTFDSKAIGGLSEMDAIYRAIGFFQDNDLVWVKVKEMRELIKSKYDIDIGVRRLGRRLKNDVGLDGRKNPDSEYRMPTKVSDVT